MRIQNHKRSNGATDICRLLALGSLSLVALLLPTHRSFAAISWDSGNLNPDTMEPVGAGTSLWFDPVNWSPTNPGEAPPFFIPPSNNGLSPTDTNINSGWDFAGEGVIYDPLGADAANYAAAAGVDFDYPTEDRAEFDRDTIWRLYLTTGSAMTDNKLTIKSGTLQLLNSGTGSSSQLELGRGGGAAGLKGVIVQTGGTLAVSENNLQIGNFHVNRGNGVYEYFGGSLEVALAAGDGIRIAHGGSSGPAAESGTMIIHNGGNSGHIRSWNVRVGSGLGQAGTNSDAVGIVRFHANANGTQPIQVENSLLINHQDDTLGTGNTRSAVLQLALDAAPMVDMSGIPLDMGLFDVDSDGDAAGFLGGESGIFYDDSFANGGTAYNEGDEISAIFGGTEYFWNISYTGDISWTDRDISDIDQILGAGNGNDVVLIGNRSETLPGLFGDYNENDEIDAADYTVWRDALTAGSSVLANDSTPGTVDESDFLYWRNHFGETLGAGAGSGSATVPEPSAMLLVVAASVGAVLLRRRD